MHSQEHILNNIKEHLYYFEVRTDPEDEWGERDVMKLSIGCTLYFYNGHKPEIRALMPKLLKEFYDQFGQYFTGGYMVNKDSQKVKTGKLTPRLLEKCFDAKTWQDVDEAMEWTLDNPDSEATTGYRFSGLLQDEYTSWDDLSSMQLAIPYDKLDILDAWLAFIKKICQHIRMHYGYVGYHSLLPDQYHAYEEHQTPIAYRFYGCAIDRGFGGVTFQKPPLGIKGINWLTIIGKPFVEQMGGEAELTNKAKAYGLDVEILGENMLIQAGPYPDICDNEDLPMNPYYVAVNHLLKPIRKATIGSLHMSSMTGKAVLEEAASDEWLRRFDQYPIPEPLSSNENLLTPSPVVTPPPSRYTGYSVAEGQVCQETGHYECPRQQGRTILLMQGQPLKGEKHNEMGAIIWYKLTVEAEREYLDNRKKNPLTGNWE